MIDACPKYIFPDHLAFCILGRACGYVLSNGGLINSETRKNIDQTD